jgi:hypothetical protein
MPSRRTPAQQPESSSDEEEELEQALDDELSAPPQPKTRTRVQASPDAHTTGHARSTTRPSRGGEQIA